MKKTIARLAIFALAGMIVSIVFGIGLAYGLTGVVNNYYGPTTVDQTSTEIAGESMGGNVTATGGLCNASDPATTMCNVDINYLDVTTELAVDGATALTGTTTSSQVQDAYSQIITRIDTGSLADATTTILGIKNPFGATSTVTDFVLRITGVATTTAAINCGTSTTAYAAASVAKLINAYSLATSTIPKEPLRNDTGNGAIESTGTTVGRLSVKPAEYIVCAVTTSSTAYDNAFTSAANTFDGTYVITWRYDY